MPTWEEKRYTKLYLLMRPYANTRSFADLLKAVYGGGKTCKAYPLPSTKNSP